MTDSPNQRLAAVYSKKKRSVRATYLYDLLWQHFKRNEIIFYARNALDYVMFKEIHRLLPQIGVYTYCWRTKRYLKSLGVPYRSWPGFPRAVITAQYLKSTFNLPQIKKITVFHGMAKDVIFSSKNNQFDLLLVMGEYAAQRFRQAGVEQFQIVGYPKIDPLFNNTIDYPEYARRLGLDPAKKTILYAPTWGNNHSLAIMAQRIEELGADYNLLVKLHEITLKQWGPKFKGLKQVKLIEDPDIVPYYGLADLLISDFSSVIFEYAVLDRPIVLLADRANAFRTGSIGYQWRDIGIEVADFDALRLAVQHSLRNPAELSAKRNDYARRLFKYQDGSAARRAAAAIREFCNTQGIEI